MRDLITHLQFGLAMPTQASAAGQVRGPAIDCLGFNALAFAVVVTGGTLSESANYALSLEEADADVNGNPVNWGAVPEAKMFGDRIVKAAGAYKLGTSATLHRFVRFVLTTTGTPGSAVVAMAVKGHLGTEGKAW